MKKVIFMLLLLFTLTTFTGCGKKGELDVVKDISKEDIFNQKEERYYVYFHRIECPDCQETDPNVINYAKIIKDYDNCGDKRKIYAVLVYTQSEKPGESTYIYREYKGEGGQGTDGKYYVNGVTKWEDLYIATTASLIAINTTASGEKVAQYVAQGVESITQSLENQLNKCYQ